MAFLTDYYRIVDETMPNKLPNISTEQLEKYYGAFAEFRGSLMDANLVDACVHRMALIRGEIQSRRMEAHSQQQHGEAIGQGRKILFWARVGGIAALIGTIVLLFSEIPFSKLLRAMSSQASPTSSKQTPPTGASTKAPTVRVSPSATPSVSPTPESTSTPAQTPIKFPPPAP